MTRFRSQRGSLAESLKTVVEINDAAGLLAHLQKILAPCRCTSSILLLTATIRARGGKPGS
jgi:hypothetical protein